jgi:hypothetical protein
MSMMTINNNVFRWPSFACFPFLGTGRIVPYGDVIERDGAGGQSGVALLDGDGVAGGEAVKGHVEVVEGAIVAAHRN